MGDLNINTRNTTTPVQQQNIDKTQHEKSQKLEKSSSLKLKLIEIVKRFLFGIKSKDKLGLDTVNTVLKGLNQTGAQSAASEADQNKTLRQPIPVPPRPKTKAQARQPKSSIQPKDKSEIKNRQATPQKSSHGPIPVPPRPKIAGQRVQAESKPNQPNQQKSVHGPIAIPPRPEIAKQRAQREITEANDQKSLQVPIQHKHQGLSPLRNLEPPPRERIVTLNQERSPILGLAYQSLSITPQDTPPPLPPRDEEPPLPPRDEEPPPLPPRDEEEFAPPAPPPPPPPNVSSVQEQIKNVSHPTESASEEPEQNFEVYGGIVINRSMLGKAAQVEDGYEVPKGDATDEEWEMDTQEDLTTEGTFKKAKTTEDYLREIELRNQQEEVKETPQTQQSTEEPNLFDAILKRRRNLNEDE